VLDTSALPAQSHAQAPARPVEGSTIIRHSYYAALGILGLFYICRGAAPSFRVGRVDKPVLLNRSSAGEWFHSRRSFSGIGADCADHPQT